MIERIKFGEKEIVLVGTAHISAKSVELVRETIEKEQPDTIAVELCSQRFMQLKQEKKWRETDIIQLIQTGKTYLFLVNLMLANLQKKMGLKLGIKPGSEMIEATKIAEEKHIPIALVDRNVTITLKRAMSEMSFIEKAKIAGSILMGFLGEPEELTPEKIEALKNDDMMTKLMNELAGIAPTVKRVLVDERDVYIANNIRKTPGKKIVAIVGAGHLKGIKANLFVTADLKELRKVKEKNKALGFLKWAVLVGFIAVIVYSIVAKGLETSLMVLASWFLINGVLSALGVLIAKGHVFTMIAAFIVAPITSLNPFLTVGWVAAAVETKIRHPKVKDFEDLDKIEGYSTLTKNNVTRVLLVAALANVGSTLGTVIAVPALLSLLL